MEGSLLPTFSPPQTLKPLRARFILRGIQTRHFSPYIFRDAFGTFNTDYVRHRLDEITSVNTDLKPSSYLYNLMLWSETHGGRGLSVLLKIRGWHIILAVLFVLLSSSFFIFRKKYHGRLLLDFHNRFFRDDIYADSASCISGDIRLYL